MIMDSIVRRSNTYTQVAAVNSVLDVSAAM